MFVHVLLVSLKIAELREWACTCGRCRQRVPVATSRPTELIKRFSLALGYRSERGCALVSHYLTGICWITNQEMQSVCQCLLKYRAVRTHCGGKKKWKMEQKTMIVKKIRTRPRKRSRKRKFLD